MEWYWNVLRGKSSKWNGIGRGYGESGLSGMVLEGVKGKVV